MAAEKTSNYETPARDRTMGKLETMNVACLMRLLQSDNEAYKIASGLPHSLMPKCLLELFVKFGERNVDVQET